MRLLHQTNQLVSLPVEAAIVYAHHRHLALLSLKADIHCLTEE